LVKEVKVQIRSTRSTQRNIRNTIQNKSYIKKLYIQKASHHNHPVQPPTRGRGETSYERAPQELPLNQNLQNSATTSSPPFTGPTKEKLNLLLVEGVGLP
jgi:hypothetical protein